MSDRFNVAPLSCNEHDPKRVTDYDQAWKTGDDTALPEDDAIHAAFPTRSGRHDLYGEAMRLVGARHSKTGLVSLVTWLLLRAEGGAK